MFLTFVWNVIVPVVPGPPGVGLGNVVGEPVPVFGMPAPTSLPPVESPRACSCAETSKLTFVVPFACGATATLPGAKVPVCVSVFCVNVIVGVNVAS